MSRVLRIKFTKRTLTWSIVAVLVLIVITSVVWLIVRSATPEQTADAKVVTTPKEAIYAYADIIPIEQPYSTLPEAERAGFLAREASTLGFDVRQQLTPEALTLRCIEVYGQDLQQIAAQHQETIESYLPALHHAKLAIRDNCYANYDPEGKILPEEMPAMMSHP